jgi:hypothetical protein
MSNDLNLSNADTSTVRNALGEVSAAKIINVTYYDIGKEPSIGIGIYYNTKEECSSGIIDNGKHFKVMIHGNGSLVYLTGYKVAKKMRQGKVKSLEDAIKKIVSYAKEA